MSHDNRHAINIKNSRWSPPAPSFASRQLSEFVEDKLADCGVHVNFPGSTASRFKPFEIEKSWISSRLCSTRVLRLARERPIRVSR